MVSHAVDLIRRRNSIFMSRDVWGSAIENATLALYSAVLHPGCVAVDVGANIGDHTAALATVCKDTGRVFAFEPVPDLLAKAKSRNGVFSNVEFIDKAVTKSGGNHVDFYYFPVEHGLSGLRDRAGVSGRTMITAETTTLDAEIGDARVDLIKLDIEGAEFDALQGATKILSQSSPLIVFEHGYQTSADAFNYTAVQFFEFFESYNYLLFYISGAPCMAELWDDVSQPWQIVAIHRYSPYFADALSSMQNNYMHSLRASVL